VLALPRRLVASLTSLLLVGGSLVAVQSGAVSATTGSVALQGVVPPIIGNDPHLRILGGVSPGTRLTIAVTLRLRNFAGLDRLLTAISSPGSSRYGRYLTQAQANRLFDPTVRQQRTVETWLRNNGLHITQTFDNHLAVGATGPAMRVERLFHVSLSRYRAPIYGHATAFFAPSAAPRVPSRLNSIILGVLGLDNIPLHPAQTNGLRDGSAPYFPQDVADAYDVNPLWTAGFEGAGQRIGITLWTPPPRDKTLLKYAKFTKVVVPTRANRRLVVHNVNGGNRSADDEEGGLDVEFSSGMAPAATIDFWLMKDSTPPYDYNALNVAGTTKGSLIDHVITDSWGECEDTVQNQKSYQQLFAANSITGHNYFFSAGDNGSYCPAGLGKGDDPYPSWPASSQYVTSVGGTAFIKSVGNGASPGTWPGETTWVYEKKGDSGGDCDTSPCPLGSGGGFSRDYKRPSWQPLSYTHSAKRGYPDVAALADPNTGVLACDDQFCVKPSLDASQGGTSLSSPIWAGITADINGMLATETQTFPTPATTGFIDPTLYGMSKAPQEFVQLHDIVKGKNGAYKAAAGWDPVTGLGSPDAYNLARDWLGQTLAYWLLKSSTVSATTTITWETLRPVIGYNVYDGTTLVNTTGPATSTTADFKYATTHVFVNTPTIQPVYPPAVSRR
jgi:subtilase family serine protease